jgi:hypothetical protein
MMVKNPATSAGTKFSKLETRFIRDEQKNSLTSRRNIRPLADCGEYIEASRLAKFGPEQAAFYQDDTHPIRENNIPWRSMD